jgi:hypothetical protein
MPYERYRLGSISTQMSTDLNSMANNALVVAAADFDNTPGTNVGYTMAEYELVCTFGTAPAAGTVLSGWWLSTPDGTNREDGSTSITPARAPDFVFPVRAVTTAQRIKMSAPLPPGVLRMLLKNDGTGQSLAASGNTVKIRPFTYDGV